MGGPVGKLFFHQRPKEKQSETPQVGKKGLGGTTLCGVFKKS